MIEVRDLTKRYPGRTAVDGLTFSVGRGEVVGFLGPNGAGKSTTMRILAADTPQNLEKHLSLDGQVVAEIAATAEALREVFRDLPDIERIDLSPAEGDFTRLALTPKNGCDLRPVVFEQVRAHGWTLRELSRSRHSLEDIFVHLTKGRKEDV